MNFATEHDENKPGLEELIETRYSDDEYPWPDGMEPWLIENGGSGIIPDGARNNYGKNKPKSRSWLAEEKKDKKHSYMYIKEDEGYSKGPFYPRLL